MAVLFFLFFVGGLALRFKISENATLWQIEPRDLVIKAGLVGAKTDDDIDGLGGFIRLHGIPALPMRYHTNSFLRSVILSAPFCEGKGDLALLYVYLAGWKLGEEVTFACPAAMGSNWTDEFARLLVPLLPSPSYEQLKRYARSPDSRIYPRLLYCPSQVSENLFMEEVVMPYVEALSKRNDAPFMAVSSIYAMVNGKPLPEPLSRPMVWNALSLCGFPIQPPKPGEFETSFLVSIVRYFSHRRWHINLIAYAVANAYLPEHWTLLMPIMSIKMPKRFPGYDNLSVLRELLRDGLSFTSFCIGYGEFKTFPTIQSNVFLNILRYHPEHCRQLPEEVLTAAITLWNGHEQSIPIVQLERLMRQMVTVMDGPTIIALYGAIVSARMNRKNMAKVLLNCSARDCRQAFLAVYFFLPFKVFQQDLYWLSRLFAVWCTLSNMPILLPHLSAALYRPALNNLLRELLQEPKKLLVLLRGKELYLDFILFLDAKHVNGLLEMVEYGMRADIIAELSPKIRAHLGLEDVEDLCEGISNLIIN